MHNLIILGSGRSGTSMAAGLFHQSGCFMGEALHAPNPANPKGFFEDKEINAINEAILSPFLPSRPKGMIGDLFFSKRLAEGHMWLARIPVGTHMTCTDLIQNRIRRLTAREPFCFKDPRFSYTLPCWRPLVKNIKYLVIFRHPADTAQSIAKECQEAGYLRSLSITREDILETWELMYSHILASYREDGTWLFLHYDQMLDQRGLDRLETFADVKLDRSFPDSSLKRSSSQKSIPAETNRLYKKLCQMANYRIHQLEDALTD